MTHYLLIATYKKFVKYHYGQNSNTDVYDLENVNVPVHILYGLHDNLADPEVKLLYCFFATLIRIPDNLFQDCRYLYTHLTNSPNKTIEGVSPTGDPPFNHIDFVFAKDIDILFNMIMQLIQAMI